MRQEQQQRHQEQRHQGANGNAPVGTSVSASVGATAGASVGSCASPAQRRANRKNAKRSTGPRTAEGKARAARNAQTHGAFCRDVLLPGEDPLQLCELIVGVYDSFSPQTELERDLADRIVWGQWRLRRLRRSERYAYGTGADRRADRDETDYLRKTWEQGRGLRHRQALYRVLRMNPGDPAHPDDAADARAAAEAQRAFDAKDAVFRHGPAEQAAGMDVAQALADPAGALERFSRIGQRLEQSVTRAIRELRQLREDELASERMPCPYLEGFEDEEQEDDVDVDEHDDDDEDMVTEVTMPLGEDDAISCVGVPTSVGMGSGATDRGEAEAQNEPNSPNAIAGDGESAGYAEASCNIDFTSLLKRAAFGAATVVNNRRRDVMSA